MNGYGSISMNRIPLPLSSRTELKKLYLARKELYERTLFETQRRLKEALIESGVQPTLKYRVKSFDSFYEKILRRLKNGAESRVSAVGDTANYVEIPDILGIRVVCPFMEDLTRVETVLQERFGFLEVERKGSDYSAREFGYESTHCLISVPRDVLESFHISEEPVCEVQLRTILQDAWAEVEHELIYKAEFTPFDEPLKRKLAALNANLTLADIIFQEIRDYQRQLHAELFKRRKAFWGKIHNTGEESDAAEVATHSVPAGESPARSAEDVPAQAEQSVDAVTAGEGQTPDVMDPRHIVSANDTMDNMLLKALYAHNNQEFERAIEIYTLILDNHPKAHVRAVVHIHRGMAYFAESDYDNAIADFTRTLELDDDNWKAYYYRGTVHRVQKRYEHALEDFDRCLALDRYQFDSLYARAQLYFELEEYDHALADCERALDCDPDSPEAAQFRELILSRMAAR